MAYDEKRKCPGTLSWAGPTRLRANALFRAKVVVTLAVPLESGGWLVLAARHFSDFSDPQMSDPAAENYITVSCSEPGVDWALGPLKGLGRHPWNRGIELVLTAGRLAAGAQVTVHLGDPVAGCPGYRGQSFVEEAFGLRLGIDRDGQGSWCVAPPVPEPAIPVAGNAMTGLRCLVTRPTAMGESLEVALKAEDAYGNPAGAALADEATLLLDGHTPLGAAAPAAGQGRRVTVPAPQDGAVHRLVAATRDGRFWSASNPFGPSPVPGQHLFWGEIHSQSGLCDGTNAPATLYRYARDAAGLDFAAVSSHDFELTAQDWQEILAATRAAHEPGRFVTFPGVEWSGRPERGGDNNLYFLEDDPPLLYSAPWGGIPAWDPAAGEVDVDRDLRQTIAAAGDRALLVVPHCGGRRCNFDFYDERVMPLFEIHSCHRTYENVAQEALARGLRFGFIGGSDDHRGALGDSHPAARDRFFSSHSGLVAVYASALTREALWEAFFARRVYATNGIRPVLAVTLASVLMGGTVRAVPGTELPLRIEAWFDGFLDRIEIVVGATVVRTVTGRGNQHPHLLEETVVTAPAHPTPCTVRFFQTDGGRAWSSPIWMEPA